MFGRARLPACACERWAVGCVNGTLAHLCVGQARAKEAKRCHLDLQLGLARPGARAEDLEDEEKAVKDRRAQPFLRGETSREAGGRVEADGCACAHVGWCSPCGRARMRMGPCFRGWAHAARRCKTAASAGGSPPAKPGRVRARQVNAAASPSTPPTAASPSTPPTCMIRC
eukprot:scaffold6726_cov89-Isochrysis_galbana.AAC.2